MSVQESRSARIAARRRFACRQQSGSRKTRISFSSGFYSTERERAFGFSDPERRRLLSRPRQLQHPLRREGVNSRLQSLHRAGRDAPTAQRSCETPGLRTPFVPRKGARSISAAIQESVGSRAGRREEGGGSNTHQPKHQPTKIARPVIGITGLTVPNAHTPQWPGEWTCLNSSLSRS
jgi:hypothetical protein